MLRLKLSARAIRTLGGKALCMGFAEGHAGRLLVDLAQNQPGSDWDRMCAKYFLCRFGARVWQFASQFFIC